MNLEQEIQRAFIFWPDISPTRQSVLNHLYMTIGNGFEWKKGQLIQKRWFSLSEKDQEEKARWEAVTKQVKDPNHIPVPEPGFPKERDQLEIEIAKLELNLGKITKKEYKEYIKYLRSDKKRYHFYPIYDYAKVNHIPDDVKPDWLLGAVEACQDVINYCQSEEEVRKAQQILANICMNFDIPAAQKKVKRYKYKAQLHEEKEKKNRSLIL